MDNISSTSTIKKMLFDAGLLTIISWADVSRSYFNKSNSWLYHKLNGIDGNGKPSSFTDEEKAILRDSLLDLSQKIKSFANAL